MDTNGREWGGVKFVSISVRSWFCPLFSLCLHASACIAGRSAISKTGLLFVKITVNLTTMYSRLLAKPDSSTLLLGPRGTGKSTWIRQHFAAAILYDLL